MAERKEAHLAEYDFDKSRPTSPHVWRFPKGSLRELFKLAKRLKSFWPNSKLFIEGEEKARTNIGCKACDNNKNGEWLGHGLPIDD